LFSSPFRRGLGKGAFNFFIIKPTLFPRLLPKGEGAYIIDLLSVQNTPVTNPPKPHLMCAEKTGGFNLVN